MPNVRVQSEEVVYTLDHITLVDRQYLDKLKSLAQSSLHRRARLCAHKDAGAPLHEMIIVLLRGAYIRPHRHIGKTESFHIIEGKLSVIFFDEIGNVTTVIRLGDISTGRNFYYRLDGDAFHTVLPESDFVVFHETTNGPFVTCESDMGHWAPSSDDKSGRDFYIHWLEAQLEHLQ